MLNFTLVIRTQLSILVPLRSLPLQVRDSLGNLGLVNQSENSSLTNDMPIQKANWLRKHTSKISLKLELMMRRC